MANHTSSSLPRHSPRMSLLVLEPFMSNREPSIPCRTAAAHPSVVLFLLLAGCSDPSSPPYPGSESGSEAAATSPPSTSASTLAETTTATTMPLDDGITLPGTASEDASTTLPGTTSEAPDNDAATNNNDDTTGESCKPDEHESNETEAVATILPFAQDCDFDGSTISATLDDEQDVDWYRYLGSDVFPCFVDPTRSLVVDGSLRLCKFIECDSELDYLMCPSSTTEAMSPEGRSGCCDTAGFSLINNEDYACSGLDDSATVYLRVDQGGATCIDYTIDYHF